jgi:hypothetical protein
MTRRTCFLFTIVIAVLGYLLNAQQLSATEINLGGYPEKLLIDTPNHRAFILMTQLQTDGKYLSAIATVNLKTAKLNIRHFPVRSFTAADMTIIDGYLYVTLNYMGSTNAMESANESEIIKQAHFPDADQPVLVRYSVDALATSREPLELSNAAVKMEKKLAHHGIWAITHVDSQLFLTACANIFYGGQSVCYGEPAFISVNSKNGAIEEVALVANSDEISTTFKNPFVLQQVGTDSQWLFLLSAPYPASQKWVEIERPSYVHAYKVNSTGVLEPVHEVTAEFPGYAGNVAIDESNQRLFICNSNPVSHLPVINLNDGSARRVRYDDVQKERSCRDLIWSPAYQQLYIAHNLMKKIAGSGIIGDAKIVS